MITREDIGTVVVVILGPLQIIGMVVETNEDTVTLEMEGGFSAVLRRAHVSGVIRHETGDAGKWRDAVMVDG